jgi:hypothetical protein
MKRILGIILAVLGCIILFSFLVLGCASLGFSIAKSVLIVLIAILAVIIVIVWTWLVMWLLY